MAPKNPPLQFPNPNDPNFEPIWTAPNKIVYEYIAEDEKGNQLNPGYWNVVGTVGVQGPMGPEGMPGANGLHPTINPETGCWVYNYNDYDDSTGLSADISVPTNHPACASFRTLGVKNLDFINQLNTDDGWAERRQYNRLDSFMVETYDAVTGAASSRLYVIPYHELIQSDGFPENSDEAKLAHSFADMGYVGLQGPKGATGERGPKGNTGAARIEVVNSMPQGEEQGEMFLDKSTNTMFIAVTPVSN
jgi:hypothetical protein